MITEMKIRLKNISSEHEISKSIMSDEFVECGVLSDDASNTKYQLESCFSAGRDFESYLSNNIRMDDNDDIYSVCIQECLNALLEHLNRQILWQTRYRDKIKISFSSNQCIDSTYELDLGTYLIDGIPIKARAFRQYKKTSISLNMEYSIGC